MKSMKPMSSNYKKLIFLDIDGVLASIPYLCKGKGFIDPSKCKLLNQLEDIGAEVVISSSWGYDGGRTEQSLKGCGLKLPIIGYTDHSVHYNHNWACRGNEIEKWLLDNMYEKHDGLINREDGIRPDGNSLYMIASNTKVLTTLGIMRLVEDGKLDLKDDIRKYIPEFSVRSRLGKKPMTIEEVYAAKGQ